MVALVTIMIGVVVRYIIAKSPIFRVMCSARRIVSQPIVKLFREMKSVSIE